MIWLGRLALALLLSFSGLAVQAHAKEVPLWEGVEKTPAMLAADQEFIKSVKATGRDLKTAAQHSVGRGWEAFDRKDYEVAIRRFNQAWLLDNSNPAIYWGFALTTYVRGDGLAVSERWFAETESRMFDGAPFAALYSDHGRILDESGQPQKAKAYFEKALATDPNHVEAHVGMARVLRQLGDSARSEKHLKEIERLQKG